MNLVLDRIRHYWPFFLIGASVLFLYAQVLAGLSRQWWSDENYSHGLLIPFVIGFIVWSESGDLWNSGWLPELKLGLGLVLSAILMLLLATLGAELFTQRVSLVVLLIGIVVYFFGHRFLTKLTLPFLLLLLAIPIPQIIFNKIAFPLQLLATRAANLGLWLYGITSWRNGNIIDLVPANGGQVVSLEVVEACSGIRSLMTLISLAVVLAYLSSPRVVAREPRRFYAKSAFWRTTILVLLAVPIALFANAARVFLTGVAAYHYGQGVTESLWHDALGWAAFFAALLLLIACNAFLSTARTPIDPASPKFDEDRGGAVPRRGGGKRLCGRTVCLDTGGCHAGELV